MTDHSRPVIRIVGLALTVVVIASGSTGIADEGVPLYTNADLERFRIPETEDDRERPVAASSPRSAPTAREVGWEFVLAFLAREHSRLDADRKNDLDRARLELEATPPRPRYAVPFYPYYPYGRHPKHRPVHPKPPHTTTPPKLDGRDAVPGPPSHRPSHGYDVPPARPAGSSPRHGDGRSSRGHRTR